jgi:hypothetical protein
MDERVAPLRVVVAVRSLYVIVLVPGLVGLAHLSALRPVLLSLIFFSAGRLAVEILLIEMIRRRHNWARFVFAATVILGCGSFIQLPRHTLLSGVFLFLEVLATALLFGGAAERGFYSPRDSVRVSPFRTFATAARSNSPARTNRSDETRAPSRWEFPVAAVNIALIAVSVLSFRFVLGFAALGILMYSAGEGGGPNIVLIGFAALIAYLVLLVVAITKWRRDRYFRRTSATTLAWALAPILPVLAFSWYNGNGACFLTGVACRSQQIVQGPPPAAPIGPIPPVRPQSSPPTAAPDKTNTVVEAEMPQVPGGVVLHFANNVMPTDAVAVRTRIGLAHECTVVEIHKIPLFWKATTDARLRAARLQALAHNCFSAQGLPDPDFNQIGWGGRG